MDHRELEPRRKRRDVERTADHADVDPAANECVELLGRWELAEIECDIRVAVRKVAEDFGEHGVEHRRADEAHRQRADLAGRHPARGVRRPLDGREDLTRLDEEPRSRRGQLDAPAVALQQSHAKLRLERANLLAERWLRDVQALGRSVEVELLGDCHEIPKVAQLHTRSAYAPRKQLIGATVENVSPHAGGTMNPKPTEHGHDASALATGNAIEILADVLARSEEAVGDDFYSRLCEGITRCTACAAC